MAQAGYTPILIYASSTPGALPSAANLTSSASGAELAINYADGKLYFKNSSGVVTLLAGSSSGPAGGSNTQVQYNSSGVLAGSSNMTFDGTSLTLGGNPTLSAGTANGVLYLNGSKVATSGSALTFDGTTLTNTAGGLVANTALTLTGVSNAIKTVYLSNFADAAANWNYIRSSSGVFDIVASGSNSLAFSASASEGMRLTSTGLGIGTSSPNNKLQVNGSIVDNASGGYPEFTPTGFGALVGGYGANNTANLWLAGGTGNNGNQVGHYINSVMSGNSGGGGTVSLQIGQLAWSGTAFTSGAAQVTLDSSGNLGLGGSAARATTAGSAIFNIFNGTAPVGTLTNGISLYSSSGEAYVMDAAGNATLFSPHDRDTNEWIFRSKHTPSGKVLKIDVERLLRFVNDHFGLDAVQEFIEP